MGSIIYWPTTLFGSILVFLKGGLWSNNIISLYQRKCVYIDLIHFKTKTDTCVVAWGMCGGLGNVWWLGECVMAWGMCGGLGNV